MYFRMVVSTFSSRRCVVDKVTRNFDDDFYDLVYLSQLRWGDDNNGYISSRHASKYSTLFIVLGLLQTTQQSTLFLVLDMLETT